MPSLIPGYEYDIFISYRHKDNKYDGWVTEFVTNLKKELEATFKEDISIYFDENPHDGLLATHDVDESLKDKLKCLIFIPIISQTYCDAKSFAWNHEFLAFKRSGSADQFGLKIKLPNGNVSSRVLPIRIHELDVLDKKSIEAELGPLRAIDFTYQSAGVNRPLRPKDDESARGQSQFAYRDQINKTANSIKDIIVGLRGGEEISSSTPTSGEIKHEDYSARQIQRKSLRSFKMPEGKTIGFTLVVLILSLALIYVSVIQQVSDAPTGFPLKTSITLPDSIQMTFGAGPLSNGRRALDISPDGKTVVFVSMDANGISYLNLRPLDQYKITRLPGTDGAFAPFFSPDSKWIAFFSNDKLMKVSVKGGFVETLSQTANPIDGIWGEDDRITWIGNEGGVLRSILSNGKDSKTIQFAFNSAASRPTRITTNEFIVSNYLNEIRWISFTSSESKIILKGAQNPILFNDNLLFVRGTDLLSIGFDRDKLITVGSPRLIEKGISVDGYENAHVSMSLNGTLIFANGTHNFMGSLTWRNFSEGIESLPFEAQLYGTFSISPDGKKVAVTLRNTQHEIRLYHYDEPGNSIPFAKEELSQIAEWSADGNWIYYNPWPDGKSTILRKQADGRSEAQVVLSHDSLGWLWDVSSKGCILYQSGGPKGVDDLKLFSPEKQTNKLAFNSRQGVLETLASFIKDDWIGFTSDQTGRFEVFISDLLNPEVRTQVSFEGGEEPRYDSASSTLYWRNGNKMMGASLTFGDNRSFKIGPARLVFDDENWINVPGYSYDISPDGKRFLIVRSARNKSTREIRVSQNFLQ